MKVTRIYLPIGGFLLGMGVAAAGIFVTWIPEWYGFKATLCAVGLIGAAVAGALIVRGTWLATKERMENAFRVVITVLPGLLMLGLVGFGALLSAFVLGGGFFEPTFNRKVEFSDPKATVYFYDSGFLDTETTVFLRNGALPIMREVARVRYYLDGTGTTTQSGDWVDFSGFQINLATGEAKDDLP